MKNLKTVVIFVFSVGIFYGLLELSVERDKAGNTHILSHVFIFVHFCEFLCLFETSNYRNEESMWPNS